MKGFKRITSIAILLSLALPLILSLSGCGGGSGSGSSSSTNGTTNTSTSTSTKQFKIDSLSTMYADSLYSGNNPDIIDSIVTDCGFAIKDEFGMSTPNPAQGMFFDRWNLDAINLAIPKGISITLDDYISSIQLAYLGALNQMPVGDVAVDPLLRDQFLADLRAAANLPSTDNTGMRKMSQMVVALGRQSKDPYDLMDPAVSGSVKLNLLQLELLTRRFSGELYVSGQPAVKKTTPKSVASFASTACTMTDIQQIVGDASAAGTSVFFGGVVGADTNKYFRGFLQRLGDKFKIEPQMDAASFKASVANIVLNYLKFLASMAAFEVHMTQDPIPLIRTKTTTAGGTATIGADFSMNVGDFQIINCFRTAFNLSLVDFNIPQNGAIANGTVDWLLPNNTGDRTKDLIRMAPGYLNKQQSDGNGHSEIKIEGVPQMTNMSNKKLLAVDKTTRISAATNLKNKNIMQDAVDLISASSGISALWSLPIEILNRRPGLFNGDLMVKVTDWKEQEGRLYHVLGEYNGDGNSFMVKNLTDKIEFDLDVVMYADGGAKGALVNSVDSPSSYTDPPVADANSGEYCSGTLTYPGSAEVFKLKSNTVSANYTPPQTYPPGYPLPAGMPSTIPASAYVSVQLSGYSYTFVEVCGSETPPATRSESALFVQFEPFKIPVVGNSLVINNRDNYDQGWKFTITFKEPTP